MLLFPRWGTPHGESSNMVLYCVCLWSFLIPHNWCCWRVNVQSSRWYVKSKRVTVPVSTSPTDLHTHLRMAEVKAAVTQNRLVSGPALNLYSDDAKFKSQPGQRLPSLRFSMSFRSSSRQIPGHHLGYHERCLLNLSSSSNTNHLPIRHHGSRYLRQLCLKFYFVRTVHFGMKLYNDQRNAQVYSLFIYLPLPYMFRAFF
jgi:hypothetical protein